MSGYKLLLVPDDRIAPRWPGQDTAMAWILDGIRDLTSTGPFEVIADVGEDKRLRMSRALYDKIEVVEPG
jgi:hypothetical protein